MFESPELRDELTRIREAFATARTASLWHSSYPQSQWSDLLGCEIREQVEADPACSVILTTRTKTSVHSVGFAVPGSGSVWR